MTSLTYVRSTSKAMADSKKKEGKNEIQKLEYLENENSFLDVVKSFFVIN